MTAANDSYERSPAQRFQGRRISSINEKHRPLSRQRAREIVTLAEQDRDAFGWPRYSRQISSDEQLAIREYWREHAPGCWSQNDVLRQCAK